MCIVVDCMTLTVIHERWKCIACSACAAVAPDDWEMKPDTFASIKKEHKVEQKPEGILEAREITEAESVANKEAEGVCPVQCIHVYETK